jgi:methionyl-tRNA synthetase
MDFSEERLLNIHNDILIDQYMNIIQRISGKKTLKHFERIEYYEETMDLEYAVDWNEIDGHV